MARKAVAKQQGGRKNLSNRVNEEASSKVKRRKERATRVAGKGERAIEFKSIGKIRDDETRQKGPDRKDGDGGRNQFRIKLPTMDFPLSAFARVYPLFLVLCRLR